MAPLPRRYQVHLPGSCSACQRGGGLGLTAPHSPCEALWPLPKPSGQPRGGPQRDARCHPLTLCSQPIPALLGCPPPQPWQRRTPSSRALPPTPGKTLHQMVLTPGPPTSPPRAVPSLHTGGTAGSPPKGLFMAAPPPPHPCTPQATSGPGPGGARAAPTTANTNKCSERSLSVPGVCGGVRAGLPRSSPTSPVQPQETQALY